MIIKTQRNTLLNIAIVFITPMTFLIHATFSHAAEWMTSSSGVTKVCCGTTGTSQENSSPSWQYSCGYGQKKSTACTCTSSKNITCK